MVQSTTLLLLAIPLALASIAGTYIVGRRRFDRCNQTGIEQFHSYGNKLATKGFEGLAMVASRLGLVLAFVFIVGFAVMQVTDTPAIDLQEGRVLRLPNLFSYIRPPAAATNLSGDHAQPSSGGDVFRERPVSKRRPTPAPSHSRELHE